jgi:hypothetical protein
VPRLYERLAPTNAWSLDGLAAAVQLAPDELFDRCVLAIALDDRLPDGVTPPTPLPAFDTWDNHWRQDDLPDAVWRPYESRLDPAPFDVPIDVGAGTYGIWRVSGAPVPGGAPAVRLTVTPTPGRPASVIRLTRYR